MKKKECSRSKWQESKVAGEQSSRRVLCRGGDSNPHGLLPTRSLTWRVCQFRHLGPETERGVYSAAHRSQDRPRISGFWRGQT